MLKEKFPIKFNSEEEAKELATKLHHDITNGIRLDHRRSEILSKFHQSLVAQEFFNRSRKNLHPSILRRPKLKNGKELLWWALAKTLTSEQYDQAIQLADGFGEVEWPQITDDKVKEYLNHLTLAVNQPDEEGLIDYIKRSIELMAPLSQKSVDDIFFVLQDRMKRWYKHDKEKWLNKDIFLEWVKKGTDEKDFGLINPLEKDERKNRARIIQLENNEIETEPTKWNDLNKVAQKYLLKKEVVFFGVHMELNQLF